MKIIKILTRILAGAVAIWAIAAAVYFLLFARVSYESVNSSASQGEPAVITRTSGQQSWISTAERLAVTAVLVFSLLLCVGAYAAWRSSLMLLAGITLIALLGSFITGFSIGGLYFPAAVGLVVCTVLTGIDRSVHPQSNPKKDITP